MAKGKKTEEPGVNSTVMEKAESLENAANVAEAGDAGVEEGSETGTEEMGSSESGHESGALEAISETGAGAKEEESWEEPENPGLFSISELAAKHRLPGWRRAAIMRLMNWDDDIMVRDGEFREAIDRLNNRRIGGGRI